MNYLGIANGKFLRDPDDFSNFEKCLENRRWNKWKIVPSTFYKGREWCDGELDISEIHPTIFFMFVVNSYSSGFSLSIPLDESLEKFSKRALDFHNLPYLKNRLDLNYLNETGKIKSIKQWNQEATKEGYIWIHKNDSYIKASGLIQFIFEECNTFLKEVKL